MSKLLLASVAAIGLLLVGPQKTSAQTIFVCVSSNPNNAILGAAENGNCPPNSPTVTWTKMPLNTAGPPGPQGPAGPAGPSGPAGPAGPSDVYLSPANCSAALTTTPTVICKVTVPPGNYFISAIVPVTNIDLGSDQNAECVLSTAPTNTPFGSFGDAQLRMGHGALGVGVSGQMPLIGTATLVVVTTITVSCTGYNWFVHQPGIMAIKVGTIHP